MNEDRTLWTGKMPEKITIENGEESDVNEDTDYRCDECSTPDLEIWHRYWIETEG